VGRGEGDAELIKDDRTPGGGGGGGGTTEAANPFWAIEVSRWAAPQEKKMARVGPGGGGPARKAQKIHIRKAGAGARGGWGGGIGGCQSTKDPFKNRGGGGGHFSGTKNTKIKKKMAKGKNIRGDRNKRKK